MQDASPLSLRVSATQDFKCFSRLRKQLFRIVLSGEGLAVFASIGTAEAGSSAPVKNIGVNIVAQALVQGHGDSTAAAFKGIEKTHIFDLLTTALHDGPLKCFGVSSWIRMPS